MEPRRKQDKILSQLRTPAQQTQTDQPKSIDVLPDVSTEEELTQKEEVRTERKRQVQLRLEYQMQKLRIEQERRARETDEQLRQLEEQKTLEMLKLEINTNEEDELQPENLEKPIEPDGGDFLGKIGCSDDEDYLGENRKLIQAQGDNQQNANNVAASSQWKYSNSWLRSLMSQGNSRRDGVFGSAPVRQLPGPVSSNQGQHSKFKISDTSQSSPKHGFNQHDMYPVSSAVIRTLPKLKLREYNGDPLDWPEWSGMFLSTVDRSTISNDEKMTHLKTLTGPAQRTLAGMGYSGVMYNTAWKTLERKCGHSHLIIGSKSTKIQNHPQLRPYDSANFVIFVDTVGNFVNVLQQFGYSNDLFSSSNLDMIVNKLPADMKRRGFAHIETASHRSRLPNLIELNEWLQEESLVQERMKTAATKQFPESSYRGKTK